MHCFDALFRKTLAFGIALFLGLALVGCSPARLEARSVPSVGMTIPKEAQECLAYIRAHGQAPPGYVGGRRFGNYGRNGEQKLPQQDALGRRIEYQEWDIHPKVPGRNRGAQRLVTGSDGRAWYTADHYATFSEMRHQP